MNKEELIKQYDEKAKALRDEFISKLEDDKKEFKLIYPEEDYWLHCVDSDTGEIISVYYTVNNITDRFLFEHGYYFETKQEVEQHLKEQRLLFKLQQWAKIKNGFWIPDWSDYSNNKFLIYYDGEDGVLRINTGSISNILSILPTLKTREIAQECINLFGEEILEVLC